jgi:hypothetical protein
MRSLELHLFEEEHDLDLAIQSGTILPEQVASTKCQSCKGSLGFGAVDFEPFIFVIDENDQDWTMCCECAGPIIEYVDAFFPPVVRSHFYGDHEDDLDYF